MQSLLKHTFSIFFIGLFPFSLFASEGIIITYDDYKAAVQTNCEKDQPWINPKEGGGNLVAIPTYPDLTKASVEKAIDKTINANNTSEEKARLMEELNLTRIAGLSIFKSLEVARIQYRNAMNSVFGCGIIQSRKAMQENLLAKIKEKFPESSQTEIATKIKREGEKLKIQEENLRCIKSQAEENVRSSKIVINSAIHQYCVYNEYLLFLRSNLDYNNAMMLKLDASIGKTEGDVQSVPSRTDEWAREISEKNNAISSELMRANQVLPRAIETFREMERTYSIHVLLVVIYDDYLKLRDNLSTYFNAVSQLLEKTQNAQVPDKTGK